MEVDCLAGKAGKAPKSLAELCCEVLFALEFLFRKDGPGKEQRPEQSGAESVWAEAFGVLLGSSGVRSQCPFGSP